MSDIQLVFKNVYKSIGSLPDTTLPPFTILTGVNGSGKTQLLHAINAGHIEVVGIPHNANTIRPFDWSNFAPVVEDGANPASLRQQREGALTNMLTARNNFWIQFSSVESITDCMVSPNGGGCRPAP